MSDDEKKVNPAQVAPIVALISAVGSLVGVLVGSWLTSRHQRRERQVQFFREQLCEFYGPMWAMRQEVRVKSELRLKVSGAANAEWEKKIRQARQEGGVERIDEAREAEFLPFEEIIKYENRQLAEEIMPIYRKMVGRFMDKMHLADPSTIGYVQELIEFVEVWNRWLESSLPVEVVERLGHSEDKLLPFYQDVASRFSALQAELKEKRHWWSPLVGTIKRSWTWTRRVVSCQAYRRSNHTPLNRSVTRG